MRGLGDWLEVPDFLEDLEFLDVEIAQVAGFFILVVLTSGYG